MTVQYSFIFSPHEKKVKTTQISGCLFSCYYTEGYAELSSVHVIAYITTIHASFGFSKCPSDVKKRNKDILYSFKLACANLLTGL